MLSDRDISRILSFIKIKHNGEIGRLDLTSSGFVKVTINAVTLSLCNFHISVAVFFVFELLLFLSHFTAHCCLAFSPFRCVLRA